MTWNQAERIVTALIPDVSFRERCLSVFLDAMIEANTYGANKWGAYAHNKGVRLVIGNLIVMTIHKHGIWMALDQQCLDESQARRDHIEQSPDWRWETASYDVYIPVPSKNGYYTPSRDLQLWSRLRALHFPYIGRVAKKYGQLNVRSQAKHMPDLLAYLRDALQRYVPTPVYEDEILRGPEEIADDTALPEGGKRRITINAYERNPKARQACIDYYGTSCVICGFDFLKAYGEVGRGLIHVHHLKPLADIGETYRVDPINDLRPVCPNCHAIIHRGDPPFSIEQVKHFLQEAQTSHLT